MGYILTLSFGSLFTGMVRRAEAVAQNRGIEEFTLSWQLGTGRHHLELVTRPEHDIYNESYNEHDGWYLIK